MRLAPEMSREDILQALLTEAGEAWGVERLVELRPMIEITAGALWQLNQQPLSMMGDSPDFVNED